MKKKLLFVTNGSSHGGSLKIFTWLANTMTQYYEVWYCNLSNKKPFYTLNKHINYIELNSKKTNSFLERNTIGLYKNVKDLKNLIRDKEFSLVINFADHSLYSLIVVKCFIKYKLLVSQRVDPFSCIRNTDKLRHTFYKYTDGLVCQTYSARDYFNTAKYNKIKKYVIANPAFRKTNIRWDKEKNSGYIICLARIDLKQKRQDILIEAMKIVHNKYPFVKLHLYGKEVEGSLKTLKNMIEVSGLADTVLYCGVTNNVYEVLKQARMMILSSDYEGIPNAIIEAMEIGLPIISTDCSPGGAKLLLDTTDKGIIVERGNPIQMAEAIIYYIEHAETASIMGANAHNSLSRFDENKIAAEWKNVIEDI